MAVGQRREHGAGQRSLGSGDTGKVVADVLDLAGEAEVILHHRLNRQYAGCRLIAEFAGDSDLFISAESVLGPPGVEVQVAADPK